MLMHTPTRWARPKLVRPPGFILLCQPVLATKVPTGDGWIYEFKHDGFRILAHKDGERGTCGLATAVIGRVTSSRSRTPCAPSPRPASCSTAKRSRTASRACRDFNRLLSGRQGERLPLLLRPALARSVGPAQRRADRPSPMLHKALKKAGPALRFSEHMEGADGEAMFRHACAMGLEGIVSKRVASRYKSGSCVAWVKVKNPAYERRLGAALA